MKCPHGKASKLGCPDCNYDWGWKDGKKVLKAKVLNKLWEIQRNSYEFKEVKKMLEEES
jgi:hypothetical protein